MSKGDLVKSRETLSKHSLIELFGLLVLVVFISVLSKRPIRQEQRFPQAGVIATVCPDALLLTKEAPLLGAVLKFFPFDLRAQGVRFAHER